jgi:beta-phosphoglucomutase-like phosphatase (HAD superfamily)
VIQAVVFDMDGLLVDSEPVWFAARRELLGRFGKRWSDSDQERLMGVSTATWVEYVTDKLEGAMPSEEVLDTIVGMMAAAYRRGDVPLLPGASEALDFCVGRYRVGLASGSPRLLIDAALTGAGWQRCFEEVISSDECARGKPAPDVYLEIMRRMSLDPAATVVVEDSVAGVLAGIDAGAKVVAVPSGYTPSDDEALARADARLESLRALPTILPEI